jgi:hypothetical protein
MTTNNFKCSVQAYLSKDHVKRFTKLLDEPFEIGSVLFFNAPKKAMKSLKINSSKEKTIKGDAASVDPPIAPVSLHTHPKSCYEEEDCHWGWPSGEDMRESIRHSIGGNVAHFVFTVEGTYAITVNPCLLDYMKELTNGDETDQLNLGELLFYIDRYFVSFHGIRSNELQHAQKKAGQPRLSNKFYINHANSFNFESFTKPVPFYDGGPKVSEQNLHEIIQKYDKKTFKINRKSDIYEGPKYSKKNQEDINKFIKKMKSNFKSCKLKKYNSLFENTKKSSDFWKDRWFNVDFFKAKDYFKEPVSKNMPHFKVWFNEEDGICYPDVVLSNDKIKNNNNRM